MLDRFAEFCALAEKHRLTLVIGLVTGWMSGRLFVPPALEGLNPIGNPTSIAWQVKFVSAFVGEFRKAPAIGAWDLGNECNCMGEAPTPDAPTTAEQWRGGALTTGQSLSKAMFWPNRRRSRSRSGTSINLSLRRRSTCCHRSPAQTASPGEVA